MTEYSTLSLWLSNLQLNKLKSQIKNGTEVILNISSNLIGNSNDKTNFPHTVLWLIHKFQKFVKLSQMVHQLI